MTVLLGTTDPEAIEDEMELGVGDEAVMVLIVEVEGVTELRRSSLIGGHRFLAEGGELIDIDVTVLIGVEILHDGAELLVRDGGA